MTAGTPQAYALPSQIYFTSDQVTSFNIQFTCIGGDGVNSPLNFCVVYTYDTTQGAAANLAAAKEAIVAGAAVSGLQGLTTSNVLVRTAVN